MLNFINNTILSQASKLTYIVKDQAPSTVKDLFNSTGLVIWSGESNNTIFKDASVNHAFRALHDTLHLETGLGFGPKEEVLLGRIQASKYSGLLADLVYIEVSLQAQYYLNNGVFVADQRQFTLDALKSMNYKIEGLK